MKKRALSLLFASAAAVCFVCGCAGESNSSIIILDGENHTLTTHLTVYGNKTDRYSFGVIENVLQNFMSGHSGITATYESAAAAQYWQALDRRYESGNLDDVFMIDSARLVSMTSELCDLSDIVNENAFDEIARSQLYSADGAIYAVPAGISTYGLYINYGLLEQHGQQVPRNLSEFTAVCNYFLSDGVTPVACNNYSSLRSLILARGMYGVYCTEQDTLAAIKQFNADPSSLSAPLGNGIDFVCEMVHNGWITFESTSLTEYSAGGTELFAKGEIPFMIAEGQASAYLKELISQSGKNLSYGIHAYPVLDSGSVLVAQTDLICVKKGANQQKAKQLIASLTQPETLYNLSYGQSCFSPLKQTPINSDSAIIPSANYLTKGKYVLGSDINLTIPLDGILTECSALIVGGERDTQTVKAHLLNLLNEVGR